MSGHLVTGSQMSDSVAFGITILTVLLVLPSDAASQSISGRILAAQNGQAISAAQISLSELGLEAFSEGDGHYAIHRIPSGRYTVSVQRSGYRPATRVVEVAQGETARLDFELQPFGMALDATIVTGTAGASPLRAIGSVVERVLVPDLLSETAVSTVEDLLTGRIPGLLMVGTPGAAGDGAQIRIRASPSIGLPRDPIVYVDGVRIASHRGLVERWSAASRLNDIELADIERIEVIKGPAASTLYGTGASNGVIHIITRRGRVGAPVFDLRTEIGTMWLPERYITEGWVADPDQCASIPCASEDQLIGVNLVDVNKQRGFGDVFTRGLTQRYHLAARGGTELLQYSGSLTWSDQDGVVDWNWDRRASVRASVRIEPTRSLSIALNGAYHDVEWGPPQNFWASNFAWGGTPATILNDHANRGFRTPPEEYDPTVHREVLTGTRATWSVWLAHRAASWLSHRLVAGVDQVEERVIESDATSAPNGAGRSSDVRDRNMPVTTVDLSGSVSFRSDDDAWGSVSSYGVQYVHEEDLASRVTRNLVLPADAFPGGPEPIADTQRTFLESKTLGVYFQQQFDWRARIFLTGALRRDENDVLGRRFDHAFYPRVMASWVIREEGFRRDWVNQLRVRGAWGVSGLPPDAFVAQRQSRSGASFDEQPILSPFAPGQPNLQLERSEELEVGLDVDFSDRRLSASFTYFERSTKDAIIGRAVAPSLATGGVRLENVGELKAWGTETSLAVRALDRQPARWDLRVAFTTIDTEIVTMGAIDGVRVGRSRAHYRGFPLAVISERRVVSAEFVNGVSGQVQNILCDGGAGRNGLEFGGVPTACDLSPRLVWGRSDPSWLLNLSSIWTLFDDLRLTANIDAQGGHWMSSDYLGARHTGFQTSQLAYLQDSAIGQAYRQVSRNGLAFHRAGFAKLRELSLAYPLPDGLMEQVGAMSGNLMIGLRNVATLWVAQRFVEGERITDPEMSRPDDNYAGESGGDWPPLSTWFVRLNVTF